MKNIQDDPKEIPLACRGDNLIFELPSSNGRTRFRCEFTESSRNSRHIISRLFISGEFFKRDKIQHSSALTRDYCVSLFQVPLDIDALKILHEHLLEWCENLAHFDIELTGARLGDQILNLSLGRNINKIYLPEKPAISIYYKSPSAMNGEWSYIVDHSCIHLAAGELAEFLKNPLI